mgnify:CR=1 FL=1
MQKVLSIAFACLLCFGLSSCNFDLYYGKRPFDYGAAKWVCDEPSIWFVIDPDAKEYYNPYGEIEINNQAMICRFFFIQGTNQLFIQIEGNDTAGSTEYLNCEMSCECEFSSEKMIATIDKEKDTIFNGQYTELVFTRIPTEQRSCESKFSALGHSDSMRKRR